MLYETSVPVFIYYLEKLSGILNLLENQKSTYTKREILDAQLAPNMLPLAQQVNASVAFAKRASFALADTPVPGLYYASDSFETLQRNIQESIHLLKGLPKASFIADNDTLVNAGAGNASHTMNKHDFLYLLCIPNFFFHISMTYAIGRHLGFEIGKEDFDGFHQFEKGFSFSKHEADRA